MNHPYFFALPNPTHPSKLPKSANQLAPRPLEEVDGNVDQNAPGSAAVKTLNPSGTGTNKLKRKASVSVAITEADARSVARKLDFSNIKTP